MDQHGSNKYFFQHFFKSWGHFEGSDFKPFVILARVPVDFKSFLVDFFSTSGNGPKWPKMDLGSVLTGFGGGQADLRGGLGGGGAVAPPAI